MNRISDCRGLCDDLETLLSVNTRWHTRPTQLRMLTQIRRLPWKSGNRVGFCVCVCVCVFFSDVSRIQTRQKTALCVASGIKLDFIFSCEPLDLLW